MLEENLIDTYKLTENEHQIVLKKLENDIFKNKISSQNSSVIFVVGQPGCGKTTFIEHFKFDDYVIINSDNYRHLHKKSQEILQKYPTFYAKLTNYDAHLWGDELFSYGVLNGYNVLREKAPLDLSLIELIKTLYKNHQVIVNVVIAGNLTSLLATRERYEKEILESKNAKLPNIEAHNKCYNILSEFISKCISLNIEVNYIIFRNNQYEVIPVKSDYLYLLQKYREESNYNACLNFKSKIDNIRELMLKRSAPKEQFDELEKIEDIYLKMEKRK